MKKLSKRKADKEENVCKNWKCEKCKEKEKSKVKYRKGKQRKYKSTEIKKQIKWNRKFQ